MADKQERGGENRFGTLLKNLFFLLIILQFAPAVLTTFQKQLRTAFIPRTNVGLLSVRGILSDSRYYVKQIKKFMKNDDIKGLVLHIDSPGGTPGSPQAIFNELKKFKEKKPIIAVVENMATSGAYYVAAGGNKIMASPSALVGNIGVYLQLPNVKGLANNWQISMDFVQSGTYKTAGSPFKDLTLAERQMLQKVTDDTYRQFTNDVAESRGVKREQHLIWADGKIFTAAQGKELGLIDMFGSLSDAKEQMRELMVSYGMDVEKEIKFIKAKRPSMIEQLFGAEGPEQNAPEASSVFWYLTRLLGGAITPHLS